MTPQKSSWKRFNNPDQYKPPCKCCGGSGKFTLLTSVEICNECDGSGWDKEELIKKLKSAHRKIKFMSPIDPNAKEWWYEGEWLTIEEAKKKIDEGK